MSKWIKNIVFCPVKIVRWSDGSLTHGHGPVCADKEIYNWIKDNIKEEDYYIDTRWNRIHCYNEGYDIDGLWLRNEEDFNLLRLSFPDWYIISDETRELSFLKVKEQLKLCDEELRKKYG